MASVNTQKVNERLALAEREAAAGNFEAAVNYANAAAGWSRSEASNANIANIVSAYTAARDYVPPTPTPDTVVDDTRPGNDSGPTEEDLYYADLRAQLREENRQAREGAKAFLRNLLTQFNMGDLAGQVESLINQWGPNTQIIMERLRETPTYQERFRGMIQLQKKGITDIRDEAEYLNLETQYRSVFRDFSIQSFLGEAGSKEEIGAIADLVGNYSVSVNEVRDRVGDAQRVVAQSPESVRRAFQQYYNVDPAMLVQYVLDPVRTSEEINRRANAAMVGGLASQQGLTFGAGVSERIGTVVSGGGDLTQGQIEPQLTGIAETQRATGRLAALEKTTLSDEETALAQLDLDVEAGEKVRGLQSRERARFAGSAGITTRSLSRRSGL
jgi:hypothetical protein